MKYFFLITIILLSTVRLRASDTIPAAAKKDSFTVNYFYRHNLDTSTAPKSTDINNSTEGIQIYDPAYTYYIFPGTLGNMGLASKGLIADFGIDRELTFEAGIGQFDAYHFKEEKTRYYRVRSPFTELASVLGAKKEQMLEVKHYQNIKRKLNVGLDYRVIGSLGQYTRQRTDISNFVLTADYSSENKRYTALSGFIMNRHKAEENGGMSDTSEIDPRLVDNTNLSDAQSRIRETGIFIKQIYNLGKELNEKSEDAGIKYDLGVVSHTVSYNRMFRVYDDREINSNYYPLQLYDTTRTNDSIIVKKLTNRISWTPAIISSKTSEVFIKLFFSLKSEVVSIFNKYDSRNNYHNIIPSAGIVINPESKLRFSFNSQYSAGGYNRGDVRLKSDITFITGKKQNHESRISDRHKIVISGGYSKTAPAYTSVRYFSNNFRWENDFSKTGVLTAGMAYTYRSLHIGTDYYSIDNYVYYNNLGIPAEATETFDVMSAHISSHLLYIGKGKLRMFYGPGTDKADNPSFQLASRLVIQQSGNAAYLQLPKYLIYQTAYFNLSAFRDAMTVQAGIDLWYGSSYYADGYMPATAQFYLQNARKVSENISIDPFVNLNIKRAKLFFKYQHLNYLFNQEKRYNAPLYPLQNSAIKFGVIWRFYD